MKTLQVIVLLAFVVTGCGLVDSDGIPPNATVVTVTANTSLTVWLTGAIAQFNNSNTKTTTGKSVFVTLTPTESGQAVSDMASGEALPVMWIPDDEVWADVLADKGQTAFQGNCVSVAKSPLVIAMWRPLAESLGWPGRSLGWLDVGSLAADASAWAYYSGGQFGDSLRLGHTHPGLSATGAETLLAVVQAAQSKTEAVSADDLEQPIVRASVGAFESAVSWFSQSTDTLGATMRQRGNSFLGAAVMYESSVIQYGQGEPPIVPIYPFEGTFVATHPACINRVADVNTQEAAGRFRDYLLSEAAQTLALASGQRPVNAVSPGSPLDEAHGVDLAQPAIIFPAPSVEALYAAQDLWQSERKHVNLVMLLDVSGSMQGAKINNLRTAAEQFMKQMSDDDYLTLITFSTAPSVLVDHAQVGPARTDVIDLIRGLRADGNTTLYDAIGDGAAVIARTTSPDTTNAMVVLSDGQDTASARFRFDQALLGSAAANSTTVFTIAYGNDAATDILTRLATETNGNFFKGDEASIADIYEELSAAFGGSVGVGR